MTGNLESELLLYDRVAALFKDGFDKVRFINSQGDLEGVSKLMEFEGGIVESYEYFVQFFLVRAVGSHFLEVIGDAHYIVRIDEVCNFFQLVDFHEEVYGVMLGIVLHEVRHNFLNEVEKVIRAVLILHAVLVFVTNILGEVAEVLVAPKFEFKHGAFLKVDEGLLLLSVDHGEDGEEVGEEFLGWRRDVLCRGIPRVAGSGR